MPLPHRSARTLIAGLLLAVGLFTGGLMTGCSKKDADPAGEKGETPAAAGEAAGQTAAAAPAALEAPASIVGYGGTGDIAKTLGAVHGLATKVTPEVPPVAQAEQMITAGIQGEFRLKDAKAIDLKKPIRFAFADPKSFGRDPSALLVGITGKDALVAALPELERKESDQGNAYSYLKFQGSKAPVFVNIIGGHAVFTRHAEVFPKHKDFLEKLIAAPLPDHGGAVVELDHLLTIFAAEFDQGLAQAEKEMTAAAQAAPGAGEQAKMVVEMVKWFGEHAKQIDTLTVSLATTDDAVKLNTAIVPKASSNLAKIFGYAKGAPHPLLAKIPAGAMAGMSSATSTESLAALTGMMGRMFIAPTLGDEAAGPYMKAMVEMLEATTGTFAVAVIDDPAGTGITPIGLYGIKDGKAVREAQKTVNKLNAEPAMVAMYAQTGVKIDIKEAAYEVAGVPVTVQQTSMTNAPPEAMMMMGMMQDIMTQHLAFGDELGVLGYGASAKAVIEMFLGGKAKGGFDQKPGVKAALAEAAANPSLFGYVEPLAIASKLKLGGMNPLAQMLAGVPSDGGLAFSLGAEGGHLQAVLYVPVKTVQQGMAAFEKNKGAF